ncbi:MAG TPA: NAD(P)/FAD-dependent oxidoreductase [Acetobacteraceae bacterium]|nr:NAD(P)/FAD-dependent oxidoreductase [Acetobacteraceae bacterium]
MFNHTSYDVLIVGARCAGAATAMLLARSGLRVLAVDHGSYATDTLSTHALMRGGVMQLHRWGVLPRIVAAGTPPIRRTAFHYGDAVTEITLKPGQGIDALYAPRRTVLDRTLVDAAREADAEVRYGCIVTGLTRDQTGRVHGATIQRADGRHANIEADLVIGADGAASTVARLVDAPVISAGTHASATIYGHWSDLPDTGYRWYYRAGLAAGIIPTNGGQHCVFVAMPQSLYRDHARAGLASLYQRIVTEMAPDLAAAIASSNPESRLWTFPGRNGFLRQATGPGWALVGDAGYFKDPLTAHGITDALRDAELLATAAAAGTNAAMACYGAVRDDLSGTLFGVTDAIASFAWDLDTVQSLHVTLNQAMQREVAYLAALPDRLPVARRNTGAAIRRSTRQIEEIVT